MGLFGLHEHWLGWNVWTAAAAEVIAIAAGRWCWCATSPWLFDNQLVDEITLLIYPVVIGQGTRLFPTQRLTWSTREPPKGVTIQVYRPTGQPQYATATPD